MVKPQTIAMVAAASVGATYIASAAMRNTMLQGMDAYQHVVPKTSVSVIIKNLNEEARIGRCIESILNQSIIQEHPDCFEVLLVDGGSEDQSVSIARQYPIKVMVTKRGVLHQKNQGILNTIGELLIFVDSDSYYPPYWMAKLIRQMQNEPETALVWTPYLIDDDTGPIWPLVALLNNVLRHSLAGGLIVRRSVFEQTGLFDESYDCVMFSRVREEEEYNFTDRVRSVGRAGYQQNNPFFTTNRRGDYPLLLHECLQNPARADCPFVLSVGKTRF